MRETTEVIALLGPTNTGKTHRAVTRMLEHDTGMIGLPLRLLAREVYDRVTAEIGEERVALITGEERRIPTRPSYFVATTEAMPVEREVAFLAVDEVQLAAHPERGHVFTERLLHARGSKETWFLGSHTMRRMVRELVPVAKFQELPRLSRLRFVDGATQSRIPKRSAIVAFSAADVYETAERLRHQKGGAAVVMGALSPRARNAQVALFESGEVDYMVATDAIGMGLNLDIHHVAFRALRKFDGRQERDLEAAELGQVAGRAGRYLRDGSFGTLLPVRMPQRLAQAIEGHVFVEERRVYYRNFDLVFDDGESLKQSLKQKPPRAFMLPLADALDATVLARLLGETEFSELRGKDLKLLWEACQIPEYRELLLESHVELVRRIFRALREGPLSDAFMERETVALESTHHDEATLLARIADVRTWSYVAHKPGWVTHPDAWRRRTASIEDALSMALHQKLVARFVDVSRRRVVLPPSAPSSAGTLNPGASGAALGRKLRKQDERPSARGFSGLAALMEHAPVVSDVNSLERMGELVVEAAHDALSEGDRAGIIFQGTTIGRLLRGTELCLPSAQYTGPSIVSRSRVERRLVAYARDLVEELLFDLRRGLTATARLRGVSYRLERNLGLALPSDIVEELVDATAEERRAMAQAGIEWGTFSVYGAHTVTPRGYRVRHILTSLFAERELPKGRAAYDAKLLGPWALALGYVPFGRKAIQAPLLDELASVYADSGEVPRELAEVVGMQALEIATRLCAPSTEDEPVS
jgi:ATP-dependent RNA helicase SUPV3L1/SUV3